VIVTDGDLLFPIAAGVSQLLQIGGDVGPHVVVGVSYAGEIDIDEWTRRRLRDLTPHPIETPFPVFAGEPMGGAESFLSAILDDVLPEVSIRWPDASGELYLITSSLGGLFGGHALLSRPSAFKGVAIVSGAFFYGERQILNRLKGLRKSDLPADVRLYLAVGSRESEPPMTPANLVGDSESLLAAWRAAGLPVEGDILAGETHASAFAPAFSRALRFFLPPCAPSIYEEADFDKA
jgi:predicted alpha/beta superfamily hydrolase